MAATTQQCASACVAAAACGGWTFRASATASSSVNLLAREIPVGSGLQTSHANSKVGSCTLLKHDAQVLANVGSGCDALGHKGCTSGLVGWQLSAPGLKAPISVLPTSDGEMKTDGRSARAVPSSAMGGGDGSTASRIELELFVDQQICELFLHDGRGQGSAVVTFGCAPTTDNASGVAVVAAGVGGATLSGRLSDMADSILPPPQE